MSIPYDVCNPRFGLPTGPVVSELQLWHLDQRINDRGVMVDVPLAHAAIAAVKVAKTQHDARTAHLTDGALTSTNQRDALLAHVLAQYGVTLPDMQAGTLERRLEDDSLPRPLRDLLAIRLMASKSSVSKYSRVITSVMSDSRMRGLLQFLGALRTGRWGGRILQPQNFPRPDMDAADIEMAILALKAGCADLVYADVMNVCANALRGLIIAPPGKKLVVADLAGIEGRVLAWLAGEHWKLDAFRLYDTFQLDSFGNRIPDPKKRGEFLREGPDMYVLAYARALRIALEAVTKDNRQIGKVMELALGYQGAVGAFTSMAALYGVVLPEERVLEIVKAWRAANSNIVNYWYALERAAIGVTEHGGEMTVGPDPRSAVTFDKRGTFLRCRLPSGRYLCYPAARVVEGERGPKLTYYGQDTYTRKWGRVDTYGGKTAEQITQGTARDVLAWSLPRIEEAGYEIVLTVHDEPITESVDGTGDDLARVLAAGEYWTEGLPLAASGFECDRYRKG